MAVGSGETSPGSRLIVRAPAGAKREKREAARTREPAEQSRGNAVTDVAGCSGRIGNWAISRQIQRF